jgi:hemerythrin
MAMVQNKESVQTRLTTINAAFLKDIKDDNRELKRLFDAIAELTFHPQMAVNHWPELVDLMDQLVDQTAMHFSLEEAYGYFDNAIEVAIELSEQAQNLRGQHVTLFEELVQLDDSLVPSSENRLEKVQSWLTQYKQFQSRFRAHEEAELELVLSAIDDDLGVPG